MAKNKTRIGILIADDHAVFRYGLRKLLESEPGLMVVGEAVDGSQVAKLTSVLKPAVLMLDLAMPRLTGIEVLRELASAQLPGVRVYADYLALLDYLKVDKVALRQHLLDHSVKRGDFVLRSGKRSDWFIDAKQTTCSPDGMLLVADAFLAVLPEEITAVPLTAVPGRTATLELWTPVEPVIRPNSPQV